MQDPCILLRHFYTPASSTVTPSLPRQAEEEPAIGIINRSCSLSKYRLFLPLVVQPHFSPTNTSQIHLRTVSRTRCSSHTDHKSTCPPTYTHNVSLPRSSNPGPHRRWWCRILPVRSRWQPQGRREELRRYAAATRQPTSFPSAHINASR